MHIVAVLEYPADDSAELCFIDLDKLDPKNETHMTYLKVLKASRKKGDMMTLDNCNDMVMYGNEEMEKAVVKPTRLKPLEVKEAVTIWG